MAGEVVIGFLVVLISGAIIELLKTLRERRISLGRY
jgi:hypothetical protein